MQEGTDGSGLKPSADAARPICDYCGRPAERCTGADIYPHRPDLASKQFFRCVPCGAYVGCHVHSGEALGRLANAELRAAKMRAHAAFDPMWQGWKSKPRKAAYAWLAEKLGIPKSECHIGMFDVEACRKVVAICSAEGPGAKRPEQSPSSSPSHPQGNPQERATP